MDILFGNLSVEQIEERAGVQFPTELKELMNATHQDRASRIDKGKWHCFEDPFLLVCGDRKLAIKIIEYLEPLQFETHFSIGVQKKKKWYKRREK